MIAVRRAITLIEVVVVIAVIAALVSLTIPAIIAVRSAAIATRALNQIRQINLATLQVFENRGGKCWSHMPPYYQLGDHLGAAHMYSLQFGENTYRGSRLFENPTDPSLAVFPAYDRGSRGNSSYCYNALIALSDRRFPENVPDGVSHTILNSEHYARCGPIGPGRWSDFIWSLGSSAGGGPRRASFADQAYGDKGPKPGQPHPNTTFQLRPAPSECDHSQLQATQQRGLLIGLADGSARFLSSNVGTGVFWAMVDPNSLSPLKHE